MTKEELEKATEQKLNILIKIKVRPVEEQRDYLLEQNMLLAGKIATLEKENAELKDALKGKRCSCMTYLNFKDLEKQLTKAKQIIRELLELNYSEFIKTNAVFLHADKFLKES